MGISPRYCLFSEFLLAVIPLEKKKKKVWTIWCLFELNNQYFEPCLNHLLFETLDIFSCVAVKCFFSAVQQT